MSNSKQNPDRKSKVQAFQAKAKQENQQQQTPKTHLVPYTEWQSTEILELRGDLLQALEDQYVLTFQALIDARNQLAAAGENFQKSAHIIQMIMQHNIKLDKVKLKYTWNNGETPTEVEIKEYTEKIEQIRDLQKKKFEEAKAQENASKTGLVGVNGQPIGTSQDLTDLKNILQGKEVDEDENEKDSEAVGKANEAAGELKNSETQPANNDDGETSAE